MNRLQGLLYAFPVQLLLLHLKKHHFLLLFWVMLALLVTSVWGQHYGVNYLFLDPEYLGEVDFLSFGIIGAALGAFTMTWNITAYILHAHRFPFLATLHRPFMVFMLNNAIIPVAFLTLYAVHLVAFQRDAEFTDWQLIAAQVLGLFTGMAVMVLLTGTYFFQTNKDIWQILGLRREDDPVSLQMDADGGQPRTNLYAWRVDTYFSLGLRPRIVRSVEHYDIALIQRVYRQHHGNAVFIEIAGLAILFGLALGIDVPFLRLPAGASILVLFGVLLALSGAFSYWIRGWRAALYIVVILALNLLMQQELFQNRNAAYGLDYTVPAAPYTLDTLIALSSPKHRAADRAHWLRMLDRWAAKQQRLHPDNPRKPKLVLLNASGGGLRAGFFATRAMQYIDSMLVLPPGTPPGGLSPSGESTRTQSARHTGSAPPGSTSGAWMEPQLMDRSFLLSGASGGMLGLAWYRELCRPQRDTLLPASASPEARLAMARDILNPVGFTVVVNDLFVPWQRFETAGQRYRKDRAYVFERILHEHTQGALDHPISAFAEAEYRQEIPALVLSPTIINDGRRLFISPQPVSWLCRPENASAAIRLPQVDGVDFRAFFRAQSADSLRMGSALRMNATFPYILPNAALPSDPLTEVMDAGLRDNFGLTVSTRFVHNFKDWIRANTSGVVIVEFRGHEQFEPIADYRGQTFLEKLFSPVGNLFSNWSEIQDYQQDFLIDYAAEALGGRLDVVTLEYLPSQAQEKASVSLHLTDREVRDIAAAVELPHNRAEIERLVTLLR